MIAPVPDNGNKTPEERVEKLEQVFIHLITCLGIQLTRSPEGLLGYRIPTAGPIEGWGVIAKILNELEEIRGKSKILIPGMN